MKIYNELSNERLGNDLNFTSSLYWEVASNIDTEMEATLRSSSGVTKRRFYNYILLDGTKVKKIIASEKEAREKGIKITDMEKISAVSDAIFYLGKGQADRAIQHLYEALDKELKSEEVEQIRRIWNIGEGVIVYQFYQNSTSFEASTREAILIDFVGKSNLTNIRNGTMYGNIRKWNSNKLYNMGLYFILGVFTGLTSQKLNAFIEDDLV